MTTIASDARERIQTRARIVWGCWAVWGVLVLVRYYVQIWSALRHPSLLLAPAAYGAWQTLYCAVGGAAAVIAVATIGGIWRVVRQATGERAARSLGLAAAALFAILWFNGQAAAIASLSTLHASELPALGEAAARAATGLCGAALVVLASFSAGDLVLSALGLSESSRAERRIVALTLGFGALALCSSALAFAGMYRPWIVAVMIGGALAAGAVKEVLSIPGGLAPTAEEYRSAHTLARPAGMDYAWLALAFLALSFALVGALAPETEYDALWYHLNFPRLWLEAGRPVDLVQEFPSLYPMAWELVLGAGLAMGGAIAAKLLHFSCLLVLAATVTMTCRIYCRVCSPYTAVGMLVTFPTVLWEATTAYNDLAVAMFASVACYALARFVDTGDRSWLTVSGIEFGLAASTKHLGLVVLAAAVAVFVWDAWRRKLSSVRLIRTVATLAVIAIALPLPWYLRAWYGSGNPFFPELYRWFGGGPPMRWDAAAERGLAAFKAHFGMGRSIGSLVRLPWDATVHSALFGGSFGPLCLISIPGCVIGQRGRNFAAVLGIATFGYMAVWASPISSYQMRFLVPVSGALALLAADGWHRITGNDSGVRPPVRQIAGIVLVGVACLNLPPFTTLHEADRTRQHGWLTHVMRTTPVAVVTGREPEAQYLARTVPSYLVWQYANTHLPADASVLTFTDGDNFYSSRTRFPHDSVLARPAVWTARTDADVINTLRQLRIDYVIFDRRILPQLESYHLPIAGESLQRACATLYDDGRYRLCRLASAPGRSTAGLSVPERSLP